MNSQYQSMYGKKLSPEDIEKLKEKYDIDKIISEIYKINEHIIKEKLDPIIVKKILDFACIDNSQSNH